MKFDIFSKGGLTFRKCETDDLPYFEVRSFNMRILMGAIYKHEASGLFLFIPDNDQVTFDAIELRAITEVLESLVVEK